jgi:hypothetical protein
MAEIKKAKVKQSNISQAVDLLKDLPKKVKEEHSLREAVKGMYPTIRGVLKKGYSYAEVATMLKKAEITISETTLRQYIQEIVKQNKKSSQTTQKDEQSKSVEIVQSQANDSDEVSLDLNIDVANERAEVESDAKPEADINEPSSELTQDPQQDVTNPDSDRNVTQKKLRQSGQVSRSNIADEFNNY